MSYHATKKQFPRKQSRHNNAKNAGITIKFEEEEEEDESDIETESDDDRTHKKVVYNNVWSSDDDDEQDEHSDEELSENMSPNKRKRAMSMSDFFDIPDDSDDSETVESIDDDLEIGDLADSEDESDIEKVEGEALIQEEEDKNLMHKYHNVDDDQPFAYAPDDESDTHSNAEDFWIEDFDAVQGVAANFESAATKFDLPTEESPDDVIEEEFFLSVLSSDDEHDGESIEEHELSFSLGVDADDDRVGWECFFSDGASQSGLEEEEEEDTEGATTDEEPVAVVIAKHKGTVEEPATPAAKVPAKSQLTSCMKQTSISNTDTPVKTIASTPIKLNTSHQPPVLGTWTRDSRRATGIIDGMTTHSPSGMPPPSTIKKALKPKKDPYRRSDAMNAAIFDLDDIMYTNDFAVGAQDDEPSKFDRPIQVGAFRRGQQRTSFHREDSLKDEWYTMTARNKEKTGRTKATPILGVASESLSRKEKRRRKKMRGNGTSLNGSLFGESIDGMSDIEDDGVERAGLGLGPPVESLFIFQQF